MSTKKRAAKKVAINYQNGKIYKIVNDVNDMIYIGSTTQILSKRFYGHKDRAKAGTTKFQIAVRAIGIDHFKIVLIELFPCTCKAELEAREYALTNTEPADKLYNSCMDGKHSDESKVKMKEHSAMKLKVGDANHRFSRGSLAKFKNDTCEGFKYEWMEDGKKRTKSFAYGKKRTKEEAYQACVDLRNQIYPLNNEDLVEPPFAECN